MDIYILSNKIDNNLNVIKNLKNHKAINDLVDETIEYLNQYKLKIEENLDESKSTMIIEMIDSFIENILKEKKI